MTLQSLALACVHAPDNPYPHLAALKLALDAENHPLAAQINPYGSILDNAGCLEALTDLWIMLDNQSNHGFHAMPAIQSVASSAPPSLSPHRQPLHHRPNQPLLTKTPIFISPSPPEG